jgi:hypothetical protein
MPENISPELQAMVQVEAALTGLDDAERARVVQWALARFRGGAPSPTRTVGGTSESLVERTVSDESGGSDDLAAFYDAAAPGDDAEKALVCGYWLQFREGATDIESQAVNTELKHLGHGIGNITRAFETLKSQRPALIVQTRKEGSSQQARKKFKLTSEGKKAVERMLRREPE